MNTQRGRDGPGTKGRGRGDPGKLPSTPKPSPNTSNRVFSYATRTTLAGQAASDTVAGDSASAQMLSRDGGWEVEKGFRVQMNFEQSFDGGLRQRWIQGIAFGPDGDLFDEGDLGLSGVREPRRGPGGSGSGSAAVEPVFAHDVDSLVLTAG